MRSTRPGGRLGRDRGIKEVLELNQIYLGDCLEVMKDIPDSSIDMILTDPPYGTTACKWDSIIPFKPMWEQLKRVIKPNGAIALMSAQPFTSALIMSNPNIFKHHWIWIKERGTGFQVAKYRPMMRTEEIIVFCYKSLNYVPLMVIRDKPIKCKYPQKRSDSNPLANYKMTNTITRYDKFPENTLFFNRENGGHPTQKPVKLMEYLIKTYTNEGETVLDFTCGSGTTAVACINTDRNFIAIDNEPEYVEIARKRVKAAQLQTKLF